MKVCSLLQSPLPPSHMTYFSYNNRGQCVRCRFFFAREDMGPARFSILQEKTWGLHAFLFLWGSKIRENYDNYEELDIWRWKPS